MAASSANTSATYTYNADGLRTSKTLNGTTYHYSYLGDKLVEMTWDNNKMSFIHDAIGPAALIFNGATYYYTRNAQGDITGIVGLNEENEYEQVVSYSYNAWGKVWLSGEQVFTLGIYNPFTYRGYVMDLFEGLYYLQSRYYNPSWGRFINADGQLNDDLLGNNQFAYCNNNPLIYTDSQGASPILAIIGIIVACVAVIGVDHYIAKNYPDGYAKSQRDYPNGLSEQTGYAEGSGFNCDCNGITVCDLEVGLRSESYSNDSVSVDYFNYFTASATAELDWIGLPGFELSAIASVYTIDTEYTVRTGNFELIFSGALHIGAVGGGIEIDPDAGKFKVAVPGPGIISSFGFDIDRIT